MGDLKLPDVGKIETLGLLFTLLPGLLAFLVERTLTARERKVETVEAILFGLAYTLAVHAVWSVLKRAGSVIPTPDITGLALTAITIGLAIAFLKNSGALFHLLQKSGITREAAWWSIWETAFRFSYAQKNEFVVLHLADGRRLFGAVVGHSSEQKDGHICLMQAMWLVDPRPAPISGMILLRADDVKMVEFVPRSK